jgi:ABC-type lipoprotein export system ATPase subunit
LEAICWARSSSAARSHDLLVGLGLGHRLSARPATLSGGEKQRVAVARALANDPPLVLADEPTGNLDSATGAAVMALLAEVRSRSKAVLCATHDERALALADRVVRMEDGRL